jgi:Protein of unknown function (DUF3800)
LVVVGAIVNADRQLIGLENCLNKIVSRHIPENQRESFVFHAMDLFNGGGKVFDRNGPFTLSKRLEIADELAAIPRKLNIPIAAGFVDRGNFPIVDNLSEDYNKLSLADKTTFAHVCDYMNCAMTVEHWMRVETNNEICMFVVENNEQAKALIKQTHNYHQEKRLDYILSDTDRQHFPFRRIKEDPLFQDKRPGSALQLADFCAYVFKRFLMNKTDSRYLRFFEPMKECFVDVAISAARSAEKRPRRRRTL